MTLIRSIVRVRRLALAAPLLLLAGIAVYLLAWRDDTAGTPRAALAETPPGVVEKIGVRQGQQARDFVAEAPSGEMLRLSETRGRPTIINFWATWCTSCLAEMPEFKALQQELGADNLHVVAINAGEDSATAQNFLDELRADDFRIGMDPTLTVADAYGVIGLPTSIFLDADGVVRGIYAGQIAEDDLLQFVRAATNGDDAAEPAPKIRLVTTVAREHVLEIREVARDRADFRSKRLRCDDSYCAAPSIDAIARYAGVLGVDRYADEDPPRIVVTFEPQVVDIDRLAQALASALNAQGDPLYERTLEIARK